MKVWPFEVALQGEASNHLTWLPLRVEVVSIEEKSEYIWQVLTRKTNKPEPPLTRRKLLHDIKTGGESKSQEKSTGNLTTV